MHHAFEQATATNGVVEVDLGQIDVHDESDWSRRTITARGLAQWLNEHKGDARVLLRGIRVVTSDNDSESAVSLADFETDAVLVLRDCLIEPPLDMRGGVARRLELLGCYLKQGLRLTNAWLKSGLTIADRTVVGAVLGTSVAGDLLRADGTVEISGNDTQLEGLLTLDGAAIDGNLLIKEGVAIADDFILGIGVAADRLRVSRDLIVDASRVGALHLHGATIGGQMSVGGEISSSLGGVAILGDGLEVAGDLFVRGQLEGGMRLVGAAIGCHFAIDRKARISADGDGFALAGEGLEVAHGMFVTDEAELHGALQLVGAKIGGQLLIDKGARLTCDQQEWAVVAHNVNVAHDFLIDGASTRLEGPVRMTGATIGGTFAIYDSAEVGAGTDGVAIKAHNLNVAHDLLIYGDGTKLAGCIQLSRAAVGGSLSLYGGARVAANSDGVAVVGDRLEVGADFSISGETTRIGGGVQAPNATIGGRFAIRDGACVLGSESTSKADVNLSAASVGMLVVDPSGIVQGTMNLSNTHVGLLRDSPAAWRGIDSWRLAGVTIGALSDTSHADSAWSTEERIAWLKNDSARSQSPFKQVADRYLEAGHHREARHLLMAGESVASSRGRRFWAGALVGYGYRPWRAVAIAAGLVLVAVVGTSLLGGDKLFIPADGASEDSCPTAYPCLSIVVYAVETVVPVVELGQRDAWRIDTTAAHGIEALAGQHVLSVLGWVLGLLAVAAVGGVIRTVK